MLYRVKFQRTLSRGLQMMASYTFSHSIDNASTDAFAAYLKYPGSLANPNTDRGDSDFDVRHSFTAGVTYNLPYPSSGKLVRATLSGWPDAFVLARRLKPDDIVGVSNPFRRRYCSLFLDRTLVPGEPLELYGAGYPGGKIFNSKAFAPASDGQQGDFGRNVLRGFDASQGDVGVQRRFRLTETAGLSFRAEAFNILNHANFGNPNNNLTDSLFGHSTQMLANSLGGGANGGFNPLYQIGGPRSIQLALKVQFRVSSRGRATSWFHRVRRRNSATPQLLVICPPPTLSQSTTLELRIWNRLVRRSTGALRAKHSNTNDAPRSWPPRSSVGPG